MLPVPLDNTGNVNHGDSDQWESGLWLFPEQHTSGYVPAHLPLENFVDRVHKTFLCYDHEMQWAARLLHQASDQTSQLKVKRGNVVNKFSFRSGVEQDYCQIDEVEAGASDLLAPDQLVGHRRRPGICGVELVGQVSVGGEQHLAMTPAISDGEKMRVIPALRTS